MSETSVTLKVNVSWWVRPYLHLVALLTVLGCEPDTKRIARRVASGIHPALIEKPR